jgi:hypothetical protein
MRCDVARRESLTKVVGSPSMEMVMTDHSRMLAYIATCDDVDKLKSLIKNARDRGELTLADAAFRRLISITPAERPGTVEHDFWKTLQAFEYLLTEERGKTARLSRTRQKVARVGVVQTLRDWALSNKETDGFRMLMDRGMPELTGEAIVLRHPTSFEPDVLAAARQRLSNEGVDVGALLLTK